MTDAEILAISENQSMPAGDYRIVPTSFDGDDPALQAYRVPAKQRWISGENALRLWKPRTVMARVPLFWQMQGVIFNACRAVRAGLFVNDPTNMAVGSAAIEFADVDTVITEARDAFPFCSHLSETGMWPKSWILIHRPKDEWTPPAPLLEKSVHVAQEVHLFPGITILEQCETLMEKKGAIFHSSPEYMWNVAGPFAHITNVEQSIVPLHDFELPFNIKSEGDCVCGKKTYRKTTI